MERQLLAAEAVTPSPMYWVTGLRLMRIIGARTMRYRMVIVKAGKAPRTSGGPCGFERNYIVSMSSSLASDSGTPLTNIFISNNVMGFTMRLRRVTPFR